MFTDIENKLTDFWYDSSGGFILISHGMLYCKIIPDC